MTSFLRVIFLFFSFALLSGPYFSKLLAEEKSGSQFIYTAGKVLLPQGKSYTVEIADTDEKRALGLSYRTELTADKGMLFIFPNRSEHSFWMKDMKFPLDIIWLNNQRIVYIARDVQPPKLGETPVVIKPARESNFVLEIPAGHSAKYGLVEGQSLQIDF